VIEAMVVHAGGATTIDARHVALALGRNDVPAEPEPVCEDPREATPTPGPSDEAAAPSEPASPEAFASEPETSGATSTPARLSIPLDGSVSLPDMEKEILRQAIRLTNGNQVRAAELLGISRDVLRYRLKKYSLGG
jgi:DNA-binding NtrC family response regulator